MKKTPTSVFLVITSAVAIDGQIAVPKSLVEVSDAEARNLLARGKARLATEEDGAPAGDEADTAAHGEAIDLNKLTKAQLLDGCKNAGIISVSEANTKAEIIAAIEAAKAAQAAE